MNDLALPSASGARAGVARVKRSSTRSALSGYVVVSCHMLQGPSPFNGSQLELASSGVRRG